MSFPLASRAMGVLLLAGLISACDKVPGSQEPARNAKASASRVVGVTFDTGTNPFHPCFRRPNGPSAFDAIPEIRGIAQPLQLSFGADYPSSLAASQGAIDAMQPFTLYAVEGTNLLVYTGSQPGIDLVDTYPHGANASSQITCPEYGLAPEGFLVIVNWYNYASPESDALEQWAAQQEWIDVIHLNIQQIAPTVLQTSSLPGIRAMVAAGKQVVIAAGNGWGNAGGHIPTETIDYYSVDGVIAAGANEASGYASFSNLDPHVVMDGCNTVSAHPSSFESDSFAGTSSASPRITGYVMSLLGRVRAHFGAGPGTAGNVLVRLDAGSRPASGPLADGTLSVVEMHEVLRKTADPTLAPSWLDGPDGCLVYGIPRPADPQGHDYHRVGYGKLSEHTIDHAFAVIVGTEPMPERPVEDMYYMLSRTLGGRS